MQSRYLNIAVKCKDNEHCVFDESNMYINIIITNKYKHAIGFSADFLNPLGRV